MRWVLGAVLLAGIVGCGGARGASTDGGSYAAPPEPPLRVDPHAGPPALLANHGSQSMLLDDHARVQRVFREMDDRIDICPGKRVIVNAIDFGRRVEVRGVDGRLRWKRRLPLASTDEVACLDPNGDRVLVSLGIDETKSVHLVTRRSRRRVLRFKGEIPLVTPTEMFAEGRTGGLYVREIPSMRIVRRYPALDWASWIAPSPDGRYGAVTTYEVDGPNRYRLLDLVTGEVRPIEGQVVDWLAADRLVVTTGDEVRVLDLAGQVLERIRAHADQVIVDDGTIIGVDIRRLSVLRAGPGNTFRGGTLDRTVSLLGAVH